MTNDIHSFINKEPNKTLYSNRLLRWPDVQPLVGICRSHAHQLISKGKFPAPIKLVENGRASGWLESEVREYIAQRVSASRPPTAVEAKEVVE